MDNMLSYVCLGSVCFGPAFLFFLGYALGSGKIRLPYRIVKADEDTYKVEV